MGRSRKIALIIILVIPFCMALFPTAQGPVHSANLWQSNTSTSHWAGAKEPVRVANGNDSPKAEPQKTVIEEMPKEVAREPDVQKPEPQKVEPAPTEKKAEDVEVKTEAESTKPMEEKPRQIEEKTTQFPETRSAGFFGDINYTGIGTIIESKEGKTLLVEGDIIYVAFGGPDPVLIGNKYDVFHASEPLINWATGYEIGRRYNIMGAIQIIDRYGRFYTAKIIEAFDSICKGDYIRPYYYK